MNHFRCNLQKRTKLFSISAITVLTLCFVLIMVDSSQSNQTTSLERIAEKENLINKYCSIYKIDPRLYVSVVYGELVNNYDDFDLTDDYRAAAGFDASVGFAQMVISTFMWIENNYSDGKNIYQSVSRQELLHKAFNDTTNIQYSVFYVRLISDEIRALALFDTSYLFVRTVGSYYARGIDKEQIIELGYHNVVGDSADSFYRSRKLEYLF